MNADRARQNGGNMNNIKKKILARVLIGIPTGIAIGYLITIAISVGSGEGSYYSCVPALIDTMGNEIRAVILQTALCALLGAVSCASSIIWQMEDWSLVKQTGIYFILLSAAMMPIAYATYWMDHSLIGFLSYFGVFTGIFLVIWLWQYLIGRYNVKKLNAKL